MRFKKLIILAVSLVIIGCIMVGIAFLTDQSSFENLDGELISKTYDINEEFENLDVELNVSGLNIYLTNGENNKAVCLEKENVTFDIYVENNELKIKENHKFELIDFGRTEVSLYLNKDTYEALNIVTNTGDISIIDKFAFNKININASTADIDLMASVQGNINIIVTTGDISLYQSSFVDVCIGSSTGKIDIKECIISGNLEVSTDTGDIYVFDCEVAKKLKLSGNTSDIYGNEVECNELDIKATTGDVELTDSLVESNMNITTNTGDVELNYSEAKDITITTTTGDVQAILLSDKIFVIETNTGDVDIPESEKGGKCRVTTDTGDIDIVIG